jgi:hypothetical protein
MINLAIAILLGPLLIAQSQPPSPTPAKTADDQQRHAPDKQTERSEVKPSLAPPVDPPKLPTPSNLIGDQTRQQSGNSSPNNWWLIIPTIAIAVATVIQVIIYSKQTALMKASLLETKKAVAASEVASTAANTSATTSSRLAIATEQATSAAERSADSAASALDIMRTQNEILVEAKDAAIRSAAAAEISAGRDPNPC